MNFNKYNGLKLPYGLALLGDINSIDSIRERLMREAPLAHNTCQSACNIHLQGSWKGCKSVTGKCNLLNHQLLQGANEQGGKQTRGNNEPHLCVFCLKDENQIPGDVFVRQVLITLKRLS